MPQLSYLRPMLKTENLKRTLDFYTQVLGFRIGGLWPKEEPCWCSLCRDRIEIMFSTHPGPDSSPPKMTGMLYINVDDVLTLHEQLKGHAKVLWGPEVFHYGMHEFAIEECNGYTLTFAQPTDAPPTCPET